MFDEFKRTENEFEFWNDTNILGTHAQRDERITEGRAKKEEVSGCHMSLEHLHIQIETTNR